MNKERAYVLCCEPRVVLFGYATSDEIQSDSPTLKNARMLIYWTTATKGVVGAAAIGPQEGSRVSPVVPEFTVRTKVEGYMLCSDAAVEAWERAPWA